MAVIVITGTPGTGKTTIAKSLASRLPGSTLIHINDRIKEKKLYTSLASDGALVVDMRKLNKEIQAILKENKSKNLILEGHILCDVKVKGATVVVLREHLKVLIKRMKKRGYGIGKIKDNVVAEATDYCGINALRNYKKVIELFAKKGTEREIMRFVRSNKKEGRSIELLDELTEVMEEDSRFAR